MAFVSTALPVTKRKCFFAGAGSAKRVSSSQLPGKRQIPTMLLSRRDCLHGFTLLVASSVLSSSSNAAMYSSETKPSFETKGDPKKVATYMPQIEAGYETLLALRDNWDAKTRDYDGDVVRRDLGTVGVKSPLFNIRKAFFKAWQIIAESSPDYDLIDRLESEWNEVVNGISAIDFQLYSVSFTELTESKDSLIRQGRSSLDDTIDKYAAMLKDFRAGL